MKTLRNPLLLIATLACAGTIYLAGCTTMPTNPDGTVRPNKKIEAVVYLGTVKVLERHPEWRPGFVIAAGELEALQQQETFGFDSVLEIVNRLPVKELQGSDAILYINTATILLEDFQGLQVDISKTPQLRSAVSGLQRGLVRGTGGTPTTIAVPFSAVPPPN